MNRTDAASLAFRLLGIWFLFLTLQSAAQTIAWAFQEMPGSFSTSPWRWGALVGTGVYFFSSWFLLSKAQELAVRFYPPPAEQSAEESATPAAWQAAALAVMGIWMIANSLPDLTTVLIGTNSTDFPASFWIQRPIFQPVLRMALGLLLTLGCHKIARWWEWDSRSQAPASP